ncbi:MAG: hypothetical protein M3Z17_05015, partial [Gemmatimonadota bacterium]|nr:hypothetical protein [Gemmatimonadota bacterium]
VRRLRPDIALGADIIAGFPTESDEMFSRSQDLVEECGLTFLHVFPYSPRPGTAAPRIAGAVQQSEISRRARELRAISATKADDHARRRNGTNADVVVIREANAARLGQGLTGDYLMVAVADPGLARGTRFAACLELEGGRLIAHRTERE